MIGTAPVVADESLKVPTSKIMSELEVPCTAAEVAVRYPDLIDGIIVDDQDAGLAAEIARADGKLEVS